MSINRFPPIQQPEDSLSCGAYCATACLYSLGLLPVKSPIALNRLDLDSKTFVGDEVCISPSDSLEDIAEKIYLVTGIVDERDETRFVEEKGLNPYGAISYVLKKFGLVTELFIRDPFMLEDLNKQHPTEFQLNDSVDTTFTYGPSYTAFHSKNSVFIVSVINPDGTLHFVTQNSQGEWFDPAEEGSPPWPPIKYWENNAIGKNGVVWNGVALIVSKSA